MTEAVKLHDYPASAFIGLGSQGAPIARRMIDSGVPTTLWARRSGTLEPFRDSNASYAESVEELAASASHIGICVLDDAGVREMCERIFPAMARGGIIAIHSTVHPDTCAELSDAAAAFGLCLIDAPVSGGEPAAKTGTLTLMLGGEAEVIERAMPVFRTFGRLIVHLGPAGAGQSAKLINNTLLAANLAAADAALSAGEKLGMTRMELARLLDESSGRSFAVGVCARMVSPRGFAHGAMLLDKDMTLLGRVLGAADPSFTALHDAAMPFIAKARNPAG